ncbi:cupin domain-containing protein [Zeimonas arvi]|uniref:cupin domain-containing protein n=1 Tax=Zeimonas arvi TaxID=2498847 RepID=UPI00165073F8|nr:cupin domain-containing protein [Zeimonas arvi]
MSERAPGKNYDVASIIEVARSADVWVREFTVQIGEEVPWHRHSEVRDRCYGLEGLVRVQFVNPRDSVESLLLAPGESCDLPPGTAHRLTCAQGNRARYLLVQTGSYDFVKVQSPE